MDWSERCSCCSLLACCTVVTMDGQRRLPEHVACDEAHRFPRSEQAGGHLLSHSSEEIRVCVTWAQWINGANRMFPGVEGSIFHGNDQNEVIAKGLHECLPFLT